MQAETLNRFKAKYQSLVSLQIAKTLERNESLPPEGLCDPISVPIKNPARNQADAREFRPASRDQNPAQDLHQQRGRARQAAQNAPAVA